MNKLITICGAALLAIGCYPTQYSHIEKVDTGYVLTKNQAGFLRVHGEIWKCTPKSDKAWDCHQSAQK
ncbi:MAG: hypothetical protein ABUL60_05850 [Myxococcales bacterium]|jgi:hypothetical protein